MEWGVGIGKGGEEEGLNLNFSLNILIFDPEDTSVAWLMGSSNYLAKPLKTQLAQPEPPTQPLTPGKPEACRRRPQNKIKIPKITENTFHNFEFYRKCIIA